MVAARATSGVIDGQRVDTPATTATSAESTMGVGSTKAHAQASSCIDYTAQGLLAAVSAVCGSRFVVGVTAQWREPLVLWQALVGAPLTGKTPALVAARRLLASVTAPADPPIVDDKPPAGEPALTPWVMNRGISSWYDDLDVWLATLSSDREER